MVKRLSTVRETWVQTLGWEDLLEKEMAIHSSTIAWKIPWTEEPGRLQSMGSQKSQTRLSDFTFSLPSKLSRLLNVTYSIKNLNLLIIKRFKMANNNISKILAWIYVLKFTFFIK